MGTSTHNNPTQKQWHFTPSISPLHKPPFCSPSPGHKQVQGETVPFRNTRVKNQLHYVPEEGIHTVFDLVRRSAKKFGDSKALGSRSKISAHTKLGPTSQTGEGKQETYYEMSEYKYITYHEYERLVTQLGSGLYKLGLSPQRDKVCIYAQTR